MPFRYLTLCFLGIMVSVKGLSQSTDYSHTFINDSLSVVLGKLEKESGISFFYSESWLANRFVTCAYSNSTLDNALSKILDETDLYFIIFNGRAILSRDIQIRTELPEDFLKSTQQPAKTSLYFQKDIQEVEQKKVIHIGRRGDPLKGESAVLAGTILDKNNSSPLEGVLVYVGDASQVATTDESGFYSLKLPIGKVKLRTQFAGMKPTLDDLIVFSDGILDFNLEEEILSLDELIVESSKDQNVQGVAMGLNKIDMESLDKMPQALGEPDIMKIVTTLPGVQSAGEGSPGIYVRGGGADQNLILIDGAPTYNSSHFLGFFSAFNSEVIGSTELHKSSIPAKYGGRLSSVLDIHTRSGSMTDFGVNAGISPISTHVEVDIPVLEDRLSVLLAGRSTYSDWVINQVPNGDFKNSSPVFYDGVLKVNYLPGKKDDISITTYYSNDEFRLTQDSLYSYSNFILSGVWNHQFTEKLKFHFNLYQSIYKYNVNFNGNPQQSFDFSFGQKEIGARLGFNYQLTESHLINLGLDSKSYFTEPGKIAPQNDESDVQPEEAQNEQGHEVAIFLSDDWNINSKLAVSAGLRYSVFALVGPGSYFNYAEGVPKRIETRTESVNVPGGGVIQNYSGPEFRLSGRYSLGINSSVKAAINTTRQYIHQLTNSVAISPTDTWKLSDVHLKPQTAIQYSIGYYRNLAYRDIETSAEIFYKSFDNILDFKVGADLVANESVETDVLQGVGKAYGLELFVRKKKGVLNGWVSYTWSRSLVQISGNSAVETVNNGQYYPSNFDKPHNFSLVSNYKITKRYGLSSNFSFSSGRPVTYPVGQYSVNGVPSIDYSSRNSFRIPDYIRWDLALSIEGNHKIKKLAHSSWNISLYNVLGRDNVFSVFFINEGSRVRSYKLVIFGNVIPSITYNLRF